MTNAVTGEVTDNVTDRGRQVLQLLIEDPGYTMPQLAEKNGCKPEDGGRVFEEFEG